MALPATVKLWHGGSDLPPEVHEAWSGVGHEETHALQQKRRSPLRLLAKLM